MIRYISDRKNLQLIMNLLRDKSPNIQFEAFHVFKVTGLDLGGGANSLMIAYPRLGIRG